MLASLMFLPGFILMWCLPNGDLLPSFLPYLLGSSVYRWFLFFPCIAIYSLKCLGPWVCILFNGLYIIRDCHLFWCSGCPRSGQWADLQTDFCAFLTWSHHFHHNTVFQAYLVFLWLIPELAVSLRSPGSFYWRVELRNHYLGIKVVVASRVLLPAGPLSGQS